MKPIDSVGSVINFRKKIMKSVSKYRQITVPIKFNSILDKSSFCPKGKGSVSMDVLLPDGLRAEGGLRKNENNYGDYYQITVFSREGVKDFLALLDENKHLDVQINLNSRFIQISPS